MTDAFFQRLRKDLLPKYDVLCPIGSGGMGVVYRADHVELGIPVAVKAIHPELADARAKRRFREEARTLAGLDHPNIVRVMDTDTSATGIQYFVMKIVEGESLEKRLNNDATEWPAGPAQAGDVVWALANYARLRRTLTALRTSRGKAAPAWACRHLNRVVELWTGADSASRALLESTRRRAPACKP